MHELHLLQLLTAVKDEQLLINFVLFVFL